MIKRQNIIILSGIFLFFCLGLLSYGFYIYYTQKNADLRQKPVATELSVRAALLKYCPLNVLDRQKVCLYDEFSHKAMVLPDDSPILSSGQQILVNINTQQALSNLNQNFIACAGIRGLNGIEFINPVLNYTAGSYSSNYYIFCSKNNLNKDNFNNLVFKASVADKINSGATIQLYTLESSAKLIPAQLSGLMDKSKAVLDSKIGMIK